MSAAQHVDVASGGPNQHHRGLLRGDDAAELLFVWKVVLCGSSEVVEEATQLLLLEDVVEAEMLASGERVQVFPIEKDVGYRSILFFHFEGGHKVAYVISWLYLFGRLV